MKSITLKLLTIIILATLFLISGCNHRAPLPPGPPPPPPISGEIIVDFPSPTEEDMRNCGGFEQSCCEDFDITQPTPLNPTGIVYNSPRCEYDLECRAGICVEGPTYQAYDRNDNYY